MKMSDSERGITYFTYETAETGKVLSKEKLDQVSVFVKRKAQRVDTKNSTSSTDGTADGKEETSLQSNVMFVLPQPNEERNATCSRTRKVSTIHQSSSQTCIQQQLQSSTKGSKEAIGAEDNKAITRKSGNVSCSSSNANDVKREQNARLKVVKLSGNRDHDYSDPNQCTRVRNLLNVDDDMEITVQGDSGARTNDEVASVSAKERAKCQIKNINELKKATPCVKLLTEEVKSLCELKKINCQGKAFGHNTVTSFEEGRQRLKRYCRTCAGLKLPLIDIFSEKGIQMRLSQQMKHLKEINRYDSLSTQMCMDCICDLKMSYKFFMQIKKAEVKLKSIFATLSDASMNAYKLNTLRMDRSFLPSDSLSVDCETLEKDLAQIKSSPCSIKSEDKYETMAEMSETVSLQDHNKVVILPESNEETHFELKVIKSEPETLAEVSVVRHSDDNDSIEEFDPDDPLFHPDSSDAVESDEELVQTSSSQISRMQADVVQVKHIPGHEKLSRKSIETHLKSESSDRTTYEYDVSPKSYVSVDATMDEDGRCDENSTATTTTTNIEIANNDEKTNDGQRQPNILKRKLPAPPPTPTTPLSLHAKDDLTAETNENDDIVATSEGHGAESKMPKLNVQNALCVGSAEDKGIMYVTVKGTKPNELLLVKVKKMDKPIDRKDEKNPGRRSFDLIPVEKALKKYETLTLKDKDLLGDRAKKSDTREQIIEEQIEEYKRKREKIFGGTVGGVPNAMILEDGFVRFVKSNESHGDGLKRAVQQVTLAESTADTKKEVLEVIDEDKIKVENEEVENEVEEAEEEEGGGGGGGDEAVGSATGMREESVATAVTSGKRSAGDKSTYVNTEEYLARLSRLKQKWEEAKKTRESLQRELDQSYTEGNIEKLGRILGEREKNLQDFQDYLRQRKIVVTRLKDEDIISLYEDRNNIASKKSLPDLIDEAQPVDYIPQQNYLECDYCPQTFASKEILEEHLKTHDYKIMHYCEDCSEEFSTNKAKRNHNGACIMKLICKYCNSLLDSKGKKRQHEQKHCDNMYGQLCDVCGEKFKHQGTLDQHVKTQHMSWEKIFQCPKCPKKFAFKQKLSFHLKSVHTTLRAYLCEDCGADFKNPASLRHHRIRKHQPVGNKRECPVCHKLVPFYSLSKHMHTHKAYTIQCPHCDKMFKNSSTLKQHVRIHEDQRQYRCDTCGVGFNRRDGLRLHMRVHQKTDSRGLKECSCQVCGEKFPNHSMLVIHRNRVHKDGRQYTCHICNRSMISTRSLEWHMSHIHNETIPGVTKEEPDGNGLGAGTPEKKRVSCYHCSKTFKTEMILRTHIKNTHMEKDPVKCPDCEQTFTSEVRLRHHMMVAHNRLEGTLPCPHCPKRFVNQLRLKTHMISHSEERPYTCEICGFNLKTKIQLIKHHQNRHSNERPLQCKYCPWRCKQVSALVCHERTHTNERPYSCSVCRQRFKYLGDKNKHERRHESLGGAGFKRIVTGRNTKQIKIQDEDTSCSEQDQVDFGRVEAQLGEDVAQYDGKFEEEEEEEEEEEMVKFEAQEIGEEEYEQGYDEQEYEETSREASEAAEVIMSMEDTTVYTEEVTADNIESAEMITDELMTNQILQSGTVVHLQQQDDSGKIQVIPVMLSLPDLSDASAEVNLATASIMYNN